MTLGDTDQPLTHAGDEPAEAEPALEITGEAGPGPLPDSEAGPSSEPGTHSDPATAAVADHLAAVREQLTALAAEAERAGAHASARDQVIVHQREELDALRAERRGTHLRPLVVALQQLRAELLAEQVAPGQDALRRTFDYYAASVEAVLEQCGVDRLPLDVGDAFDAARHSVVRTVDTEPEQHRAVVRILAEGWFERDSERVLAPAKVIVGRHRPPQDTSAEQAAEEPADV
jgi:molecular chaperone GrpE (heat shock protein)